MSFTSLPDTRLARMTAGLALWQLVVLGAGLVTWRVVRREVGSRAAAFVAAAALAAGLVLFPLKVYRAFDAARATAGLGRYEAERDGPARRGFKVALVDRAAEIIPRGDSYYLAVGGGKGGGALRFWARTWLLPRIAVNSPHEADWVFAWHTDPRALGARYARIEQIGQDTYLARVAR